MDTKVLLGQNSIMKCKVSSDPTVLYQIDWFHNNKYEYKFLNFNPTLYIVNNVSYFLGVLVLVIQE